jgi:hypothetical protein
MAKSLPILKEIKQDKTLAIVLGGAVGGATGYTLARTFMVNELPLTLVFQVLGAIGTWYLTKK